MGLKVNHTALALARKLIAEGKINRGEWKWDKSAHSPDELKKICLAEDSSATEGTKERYLYPFGTEKEVFAKAISSAEGYAKTNGETELHGELAKLSEEIQRKRQGQKVTATKMIFCQIPLPELVNGAPPSEITLLPLGYWAAATDTNGNKVAFEITAQHVQWAIDYLRTLRSRNPNLDLVIDVDHATHDPEMSPAYAYGWITDLLDGGSLGLRARVNWTVLGEEALTKRLLRYLSPSLLWGLTDVETGEKFPFAVTDAALTNQPMLERIPAVMAHKVIDNINNGGNEMNGLIAALRTWLGKPETATEDELKTAFQARTQEIGQLVTAKKVIVELGLPEETTIDQAKAIIVTAKKGQADQAASVMEQLGFEKNMTIEEAKAFVVMAKRNQTESGKLTNQLFEVTARAVRDDAVAFVDGLVACGKVFPANKADTLAVVNEGIEAALKSSDVVQAKKSLDGWKAYYAKMPQIAPLTKIGDAGRADGDKIVTDEMKQVAAKLQVDPKKMAG